MKFKRIRSENRPEVSTASLPDIIFMLLFFFMVVTVMREQTLKVQVSTPQATEIQKLQHKSLVDYIYIGKPYTQYREYYGSSPRLQLNNQISEVDDIPHFLAVCDNGRAETERPLAVASIRADRKATMGIISDVKTELRKAGRLKLNYSAIKE